MEQVIVVGGGLAGLSAAHTCIEHGCNVLVIDKNAFFGGNSTKATSGINGSGTVAQRTRGIQDSPEIFYDDSMRGGADQPDLVKVLTHESGPGVDWLMDKFGLDLSLVSRLGGHSQPRTHRGKQKFPGMTITYALMEKLEELNEQDPERVKIDMKSKLSKLVREGDNVVGCEYIKDGKTHKARGPVILATGGYGHDYGEDSLLTKYRPDLATFPTTNGDHCTGDGHKIAMRDASAKCVDLEWVQVHPTGLVHPKEPENKLKFLAAEALRGVGGIMVDANGKRIANELGRRDYVSGQMMKNKGPFRLLLNSKASNEINWHCKHYKGRGLMQEYKNIGELAAEMNVPLDNFKETFAKYNEYEEKQKTNPDGGPYEAYGGGKAWDPFGKKYYTNGPIEVDDSFHVAIVTPVVHYCMGGVKIDKDAQLIGEGDKPLKGLYGAGEINGGVHGQNRLGGSSLLDCVVYGRVAGRTASKFVTSNNINFVKSKL